MSVLQNRVPGQVGATGYDVPADLTHGCHIVREVRADGRSRYAVTDVTNGRRSFVATREHAVSKAARFAATRTYTRTRSADRTTDLSLAAIRMVSTRSDRMTPGARIPGRLIATGGTPVYLAGVAGPRASL